MKKLAIISSLTVCLSLIVMATLPEYQKGDGGDTRLTMMVPTGMGYQWDGASLQPLEDPVGNSVAGSPAQAFCKEWYSLTGRGIIYIEQAKSGSALIPAADSGNGNWDREGGTLYNAAITAFTNACASVPSLIGSATLGKKIVLWGQGERDAQVINGTTITAAIYEDEFVNLITNLTQDISCGFDCLAVSELGAQRDGLYETEFASIRVAQSNAIVRANVITPLPTAVMAFDHAKYFPAEGKMSTANPLEYNQTGLNDMGIGLATGAASFLGL